MASYDDSKTIRLTYGGEKPTHAVIWLHGLGATAGDFPAVIPHLGLTPGLAIQFVFPQAANQAVTINGGALMPAWYDIKGSDLKDKEDLPGMTASQQILEAFIDEQVAAGIPAENIVVAGFSQGGAVAYYTGIRSTRRLAGIMALSAYLPFEGNAKTEHCAEHIDTPVLAMHGTQDPVVPIAVAKQSADALHALGYPLEWQNYVMEHNVINEQLLDIGQWMNEVFSSRA
ncbi:MAG: carboxylesterase [Alteromonadaceae bacterium]|nr:MAG: carboxylesterase [Alteromonadaceae bacterium]